MPPREQIFLRVPPELKAAILSRAQDEGKNLTEWAIEALERATGLERPQSIESKLDSLLSRIESLEQAQGKPDNLNYRSESDEGKPKSKPESKIDSKPDSTPNLKALQVGGRVSWRDFVADNPDLTLDELADIACEVFPARQAKTIRQSISRAM